MSRATHRRGSLVAVLGISLVGACSFLSDFPEVERLGEGGDPSGSSSATGSTSTDTAGTTSALSSGTSGGGSTASGSGGGPTSGGGRSSTGVA